MLFLFNPKPERSSYEQVNVPTGESRTEDRTRLCSNIMG